MQEDQRPIHLFTVRDSAPDNEGQRRVELELGRARQAGRRLARRRRVLGAIVITSGAPALALQSALVPSVPPGVHSLVAGLTSISLLVLPCLIWVLFREWQTSATLEGLRVREHADHDGARAPLTAHLPVRTRAT